MDSKQILQADLLDVIFDSRNKAYGAYELRKNYNRRISRSLLITGTIIGVTLTSIALANKWTPSETTHQEKDMITITEIPIEEQKLPDPPPQDPPPQQPEVRQEQYTARIDIVPEEEVQTPPPTQDDLKNALISTATKEGIDDPGNIPSLNTAVGDNKGIIEEPVKQTEPFGTVEVQAKFIGNWEKFLLRNLNGNTPIDNGAAPGRYTVMIQFVVDIDGSVSDIRPLTNIGYGMEQEAIRVLRKATKWEPAIQNGKEVKAYRRQPITFAVNED